MIWKKVEIIDVSSRNPFKIRKKQFDINIYTYLYLTIL